MNFQLFNPVSPSGTNTQGTSALSVGQANQPRQASQRRGKGTPLHQTSNNSTAQVGGRHTTGTFSSTQKTGTGAFSHNLNLYSNFLMNQQASAFSPQHSFNKTQNVQGGGHAGLMQQQNNGSTSNGNNVSVRVKKFKPGSRGGQQTSSQHNEHSDLQTSAWRDSKVEVPHQRVLPGTAGSKTRPSHLTKISNMATTTQNLLIGTPIDKSSLMSTMPMMAKAKSGVTTSHGGAVGKSSRPVGINQLQSSITPGDKSNATTSPDTTLICLKTIPMTRPKASNSGRDNVIRLVENQEPASIDKVYLIGGTNNFDKKMSAQGQALRQTKTIFDYGSPKQSSGDGGGGASSNQGSHANFIFQPTQVKSPPGKGPSATFKSARLSKGASAKQQTLQKEPKSRLVSDRRASNKKRSSSRPNNNNNSGGTPGSGTKAQTIATSGGKCINIGDTAVFYKQVSSRNAVATQGFMGSRESLLNQSQVYNNNPNSGKWVSQPRNSANAQTIVCESAAIQDYMKTENQQTSPNNNQQQTSSVNNNKTIMSMKTLNGLGADEFIGGTLNPRGEVASLIAHRNSQTGTGGGDQIVKRPTLKSNLANVATGQHKFIKRQFIHHARGGGGTDSNPSTGKGTGKRSKNQSRSPSISKKTNTTLQKHETSPIGNYRDELNLTMVQTEELKPVPRDTYTGVQHHTLGVLTPELHNSNPLSTGGGGVDTAEIFYRSPNQKALMLQDQQQTYFTSDSHEKIAFGQQQQQQAAQTRRQNRSFALQGSPRASYYSPQRNHQSRESKNLWLNDTVPVSPQRQAQTPSLLNQGANGKQLKKMVGVTQLGTSYDFNKLKKGLDQVQNRNNTRGSMASPDANAGGNLASANKSAASQKLADGGANKDDELSCRDKNDHQKNQKETEKQKIGTQDVTKDAAAPATKHVDKKGEEEVIVFSDNHSLDDYTVGKQIGQGAYATVHIGIHRKYNKKVALKIYIKEKMKDLQRKKSVRREIKLMKRLEHPNIAKLFDAIETDSKVILVMEYVGGGSTHGFLKSKPNRQMEESEAKKIFSQLISALSYLHQKCIAHRDIKLENVMLDHRGNVKLIDFGFSTQIPNTQKIKLFCGTPSYMAPEIVRKIEFCGPPADIYAAGVLLFAFFCGCFPHRGKDDKDLYKKIANDELCIPDHVPSSPRIILAKMLQKAPETRPSAQDLINESWIKSYCASYSSHAFSSKQQPRSNSFKRRTEKGKPCSPSYIPGQKVMTPLSDQKPELLAQHLNSTGLVYDQQPFRPVNHRVISTADQQVRTTKLSYTARGGKASVVCSPRNQVIQGNATVAGGQQYQTDGSWSATSRNFSQQTKRLDQQHANMTGELNKKQRKIRNQEAVSKTEIPFIVTKMNGQTVTYRGGQAHNNQKPSTPVNIGRYYKAGSSNTFGTSHRATFKGGINNLQLNTDRASLANSEPTTQKLAHTVKNANQRQDLVIDKHEMVAIQPQQPNTSRGETTRFTASNTATSPVSHTSPQNRSQPGASSSHLSPNSDRFPNRKQSGPGIYNSEAYKAYYTHSAAANNTAAGHGTTPATTAPDLSEFNQTSQGAIAQEGPLQSSSDQAKGSGSGQQKESPNGGSPHQTINNNINIINYITTIACSHPSHADHPADKASTPCATTTTGQQPKKKEYGAKPSGGVYSPTGKSTPGTTTSLRQAAATATATATQQSQLP